MQNSTSFGPCVHVYWCQHKVWKRLSSINTPLTPASQLEGRIMVVYYKASVCVTLVRSLSRNTWSLTVNKWLTWHAPWRHLKKHIIKAWLLVPVRKICHDHCIRFLLLILSHAPPCLTESGIQDLDLSTSHGWKNGSKCWILLIPGIVLTTLFGRWCLCKPDLVCKRVSFIQIMLYHDLWLMTELFTGSKIPGCQLEHR